jgi:hypothetical protein
MSVASAVPLTLSEQSRSSVATLAGVKAIPWTIWSSVAGISCMLIAGTWDFAWHMSIGRDTFWIPPHLLTQVGAFLVGISCVFVILDTTLRHDLRRRAVSVQVLGLQAPAGVFIALWGSLAMVASAPFDNWQHNAYGLDITFATPPHMLLFVGSFATMVGTGLRIASLINSSPQRLKRRLVWLFLFVGSIGVPPLTVIIAQQRWFTNMHSASCYLAVALAIPWWMIAWGWGSTHRWGCTFMAALYTAGCMAAEWLLPLFPAEPKLGPVYHKVTHLVPLSFPLLLIVPAFVTDLLLQRLKQSSWTKALWIGPAFVLSYLAAQWPFANFLISPASRNWIFGTAYFSYKDTAGFLYDPYQFQVTEKSLSAFLLTMAFALVAAAVTSWLGLAWGEGIRRARR